MEKYLEFARKLALQAGTLAHDMQFKLRNIREKNPKDFVTEADIAVDQLISKAILNEFPDHSLITEEFPAVSNNTDFVWIIDPIDGTINYSKGLPIWAVSIALQIKGEIAIAACYFPVLNEVYTAIKGRGAFLNDRRISVSGLQDTGLAVISISDFNIGKNLEDQISFNQNLNSSIFKLQKEVSRIRSFGSAVFDGCQVARGGSDGYVIFSFKPWDMAAVSLLICEAGGQVTNTEGEKFELFGQGAVCANQTIHNKLIDILNIK